MVTVYDFGYKRSKVKVAWLESGWSWVALSGYISRLITYLLNVYLHRVHKNKAKVCLTIT